MPLETTPLCPPLQGCRLPASSAPRSWGAHGSRVGWALPPRVTAEPGRYLQSSSGFAPAFPPLLLHHRLLPISRIPAETPASGKRWGSTEVAEPRWKKGSLAKITMLVHPRQGTGPLPSWPLLAADPWCWHSPAHATRFWLQPPLINTFNHKMNMLTCSAYRAREMEERARADITVKFLEDMGVRQPQPGAGMLRGCRAEREESGCRKPVGREAGAEEEPHRGRGAKPSLECWDSTGKITPSPSLPSLAPSSSSLLWSFTRCSAWPQHPWAQLDTAPLHAHRAQCITESNSQY